MDWLSIDFKSLGNLLLGICLVLLGFGWSFIFWQGVSSMKQMKMSIDGLHASVIKLFERTEGILDDVKDLKHRMNAKERIR